MNLFTKFFFKWQEYLFSSNQKILDFLEMDLRHEESQDRKFNLKLSSKNTFFWKKYVGVDELDRIKLALKTIFLINDI